MFDDNHDRAGKHAAKRKRDEEHHVGLPLHILMLLSETFQRSDQDQQANSGTVQRRRKIERSRKSMRKRNHQSMQNASPRINLFARFGLSSKYLFRSICCCSDLRKLHTDATYMKWQISRVFYLQSVNKGGGQDRIVPVNNDNFSWVAYDRFAEHDRVEMK